jgi:hypothetical protein
METERRNTNVWTVAVVAAIALGIAAYLAFVVRNIGIPVIEQLALLDAGKTQVGFRMPPARTLHLVLALEKGPANYDEHTRPEGQIEGDVLIKEGTNIVVRLPVEHTGLQPCNWLTRDGFGLSYVLGWNAPRTLPKILQPSHVYQVEVQLRGVTYTNASLWIHCIVAGKDRKSATGMKVLGTPPSNAGR